MASGERGTDHSVKEFFRRKFWSRPNKRSSTDPLKHDVRVEAQSAATTASTHEHNLASAALQTPTNPNFVSTDEQPNIKVATASTSCKSGAPSDHELQQAGVELQASPNANIASSDHELEEQDLIKEKVKQLTVADVDALLHYIEAELQRLDPASPAPATASATFVKSVLSECQTQKDVASCFVQTLPQDLTKEVIGASESIFLPLLKQTLGGMGGVHWAGLGLSFIAWSLDNMDRTSQNHENCLKLLRKVVFLLSNTSKLIGLKEIPNDPHCIQALEGSTELALRCAIICSSSLNQAYLGRFFKAAKAEQVIVALEKELEGAKVTNLTVAVDAIIKKMRPKSHGLITFTSDSEDMVGGVAELQTIFDYLNKDCGELVAVCLHGMGGIGKSKRAFSIYQKFAAMKEKRYHCCMVVLDLDAKKVNVPEIQWQILQKICSDGVGKFSNVEEGLEMMKKELSKISGGIFLFLDNLMAEEHLLQLVPASKYFPPGSKLLITTRNKNVFQEVRHLAGIEHRECFEIEKLGIDEARELFFKEIGKKSVGNREESTDLEKLVEDEVLKLCDGLPLALIVVSSYIANNKQNAMDLELWKRVAERMKRAKSLSGRVNDPFYSRLNFSIDQLEEDTKGAFLDIVVFAVGKRWEYAERLVGKLETEELFRRSLIQKVTRKKSYDSAAVVQIHDVLYAIGKKMASLIIRDDPSCEIRITCEEDFRQNAGSLQKIVGLSKITLSKADLLLQMPRLRVLHDAEINVECPETQLPDLKAIKIRSSVPRPINFNACTGLKQLSWRHDNADLEVLKGVTQLEALKLYACELGQLANAEVIECLTNLKDLRLQGYRNLQSLPEGITSLKGLTRVRLIQCASLESIPEGISCLTGLTVLELNTCKCIQDLPEGISSLKHLRQLRLIRYEGVRLPGLASLSGLKELSLFGSKNIRSLPEGLTKLVGLRKLDVRECCSLESLPEGIIAMTSLENPLSYVRGCSSLTLLPEGTPWCWVDVRNLDLRDCTNLQRLPKEILGLTQLASITLKHCSSLRSLPEGIARLSKLRFLCLTYCSKLEFLPKGLTGLASLEILLMDGCYGLQSLPKGLANLTSLKHFSLGVSMQSLPEEIGSLTSLQVLRLLECTSLQSLPVEIAHLTSLIELQVFKGKALKSLPEGIACLSSLRVLSLSSCESLESLPQGIANLRCMEKLLLGNCQSLSASLPQGIVSLTGLTSLELKACLKLKTLPEGLKIPSSWSEGVEVVDLSGCLSLERLPDRAISSPSLRVLNLSLCRSLQSLPKGISSLTSLQRLTLLNCRSLQGLAPQEIAQLKSLEVLELSGCSSLKSLPEEIANWSRLQVLKLNDCENLESLPQALTSLTALLTLDLRFCRRLRSLPNGMAGLTALQTLNIAYCPRLLPLPPAQMASLARCNIISTAEDSLRLLSSADEQKAEEFKGAIVGVYEAHARYVEVVAQSQIS